MKYHDMFDQSLLNVLYSYCDNKDISVIFIDESNRAVYGAAMIAVCGAIEQIKIG